MKAQSEASKEFFDENWKLYQVVLDNNYLFHQQMYSALRDFLHLKYKKKNFSFLDLGCGDADFISKSLSTLPVVKYTGVDIAQSVLSMADSHLKKLHINHDLIKEDFYNYINNAEDVYDCILISYSLHHLPTMSEKRAFIQACKSKLTPGGSFLIIDLVKKDGQSRKEWFGAYKAYAEKYQTALSKPQLDSGLAHIKNDDYPASIVDYEKVSMDLGFSDFTLLREEEDRFAIMAMTV